MEDIFIKRSDLYLIVTLLMGSFVFNFLMIFLTNKFPFLKENVSNNNRKLHSTSITRLGGVSFILLSIVLLLLDNQLLKNILFFSYACLLVGLIEDLTFKLSYKLRLIMLLSLIFIFVSNNNFIVIDFNNDLINNLFLENINLLFLFSMLGLLILINGFNFIDGLNGLLLGYSTLVLTIYFFASYPNSYEISITCIAIISIIIPIYFLNLNLGTIFAGDSGAYFLGSVIGGISIFISNNDILAAFDIAIFIFYPVVELAFTSIRRILKKKSPFKPDGLHLHQLLFIFMKNKKITLKYINSHKNLNNLCSFIILLSLSMIFLTRYIFKEIIPSELFLLLFVLIYVFVYYFLNKNTKTYL